MTVATKGGNTFLQRNKKKSALALLLLFLRERKVLVVLLLLVFLASTVFISPSSWVTGLPGGTRFAAGVAWLAGKMGVDTSRWGLGGPGRRSYADLLAAFREAKASHNAGGVGWGAFFGRGGATGGAAGAGGGEGSLGFVKGSKADLEHGVGAGGAGGGPQSVAGIVDPADPKGREGNTVALTPGDLGGERSGYVNTLNGNGFMGKGVGSDGRLPGGGSGPGGDGALSGGAYASKGFFSGTGGAANTPNGLAKNGLAGVGSIATPASVKGGAAKGSLSAFASRGVEARATKGVMSAGSVNSNHPLAQAAEGAARSNMEEPDCGSPANPGPCCLPPSCPVEYAASNVGSFFDGNAITPGLLTSSDPGASGIGLDNSAVTVPPDPAGGSGNGGTDEATQIKTCGDLMQQCAASRQGPLQQEGVDEKQLQNWFSQMPGACGDPCNCGPCNDLKGKIDALCSGDLSTQQALADKPCDPLPDYCANLGFSQPDPPSTSYSNGQNLCPKDVGQCGCSGFFCSLSCFLGS